MSGAAKQLTSNSVTESMLVPHLRVRRNLTGSYAQLLQEADTADAVASGQLLWRYDLDGPYNVTLEAGNYTGAELSATIATKSNAAVTGSPFRCTPTASMGLRIAASLYITDTPELRAPMAVLRVNRGGSWFDLATNCYNGLDANGLVRLTVDATVSLAPGDSLAFVLRGDVDPSTAGGLLSVELAAGSVSAYLL